MSIIQALAAAMRGNPENRMGSYPPPGGHRPAQMMSPQALPSADRASLGIDAILGVGDNQVRAEIPLGPGKFWVNPTGTATRVRPPLIHDSFMKMQRSATKAGPMDGMDALNQGNIRVNNTKDEINVMFNSAKMLESDIQKMAHEISQRASGTSAGAKRVYFEDLSGKYDLAADADNAAKLFTRKMRQ